jgi:hypothetical protein
LTEDLGHTVLDGFLKQFVFRFEMFVESALRLQSGRFHEIAQSSLGYAIRSKPLRSCFDYALTGVRCFFS